MCSYEGIRRVVYNGDATFVPVCSTCGRFVMADDKIIVNGLDELSSLPNATCSKCGRTHMIFEGYC